MYIEKCINYINKINTVIAKFIYLLQHSRAPGDISLSFDMNKQQRQLIAELERKNK